MRRSVFLLLTVAALLASGTSNAQPSAYFHMAGTLQGTGMLDLACNGFHYATVGSLDGTPLGPVDWTGSECVDVLSNPGGFVISGSFSLNDGLLTGSYHGHAGLPDATGRVYGWGTFSIIGGSGAYAGASGSGIFAVTARPANSTAYMELIGSLERVSDQANGR